MSNDAAISVGQQFWSGSSGKWAGEMLLKAMESGGQMSPAALRTLSTLRKDEWKAFDEALIEEATIRLVGVADLIGAGLVKTVANGLGKTVFEYERVSDMDAATVSLDGTSMGESDRVTFSIDTMPLPITHKDFFINLRTLMASRERGEPLDTTQVRLAGRLVAESIESQLFTGGNVYGGKTIYGYTTHTDRNTASFGAGTWSASARTGAEVLTDVLTMLSAAETDRMYGPYWLYVSRNMSTKFSEDFKANSDKTIMQRIMQVSGIQAVRVADQLTADNVVLVQATPDVVTLVEGEPLQTVQWDVQGGFHINFKAFTIQVPLIRSDKAGRSGIVHMS